MSLAVGLVFWLLAWPFIRKRMQWYSVALCACIADCLFILLTLLQVVMYWGS